LQIAAWIATRESREEDEAEASRVIAAMEIYREAGLSCIRKQVDVSDVARSHLLTLENGQRRTIRGWKEIAAKEERGDELRAATSINKGVETHAAGALTIAVAAALDRANADSFAASTIVPRAYATTRSR